MCNHENREAAMVTLARDDDNGTPTVWCDPCIAPLIEALNAGGIETAASCCGHNGKGSDGLGEGRPGWVMLRDGRALLILDSHEEAARLGTREADHSKCRAIGEWYGVPAYAWGEQ